MSYSEKGTYLTFMQTLSKPEIVRAVADLPDDATVEDAIERLLLLSKVEQGLGDARDGRTAPHAEVVREMEQRIAGWEAKRG